MIRETEIVCSKGKKLNIGQPNCVSFFFKNCAEFSKIESEKAGKGDIDSVKCISV